MPERRVSSWIERGISSRDRSARNPARETFRAAKRSINLEMPAHVTDPSTAPPDERVVLGRYQLVERLGAGGSAEVWRAHDQRLEREVAVKLLHPHLLPDAASRARLQSEAHAAARLSHPGIVAVYDVDAHGDVPAIVLELVEGESLARRLETIGRLPEREAAAIALQVGEALDHAHERGLVHRDVKPANIVLTSDGRARLVDFGIARSLQEGAARVTATGTIIGTLRYLAPEQLIGEDASPASDIYALGGVLYEMLAGRPPHDLWNPLALMEAHKAPPPPLDGVSPRLAALTYGMLAADPALRPARGAVVAAELRSWLASGDQQTESVGLAALAPLAAGPLAAGSAAQATDAGVTQVRAAASAAQATDGDATQVVNGPAPAPDEPGRRRRGLVPLFVGLALAFVGVVVALAFVAPALDGAGAGSASSASPTATAAASATPEMELGAPAETEKERGNREDRDRENGNSGNDDNDDDGNGNDGDRDKGKGNDD